MSRRRSCDGDATTLRAFLQTLGFHDADLDRSVSATWLRNELLSRLVAMPAPISAPLNLLSLPFVMQLHVLSFLDLHSLLRYSIPHVLSVFFFLSSSKCPLHAFTRTTHTDWVKPARKCSR